MSVKLVSGVETDSGGQTPSSQMVLMGVERIAELLKAICFCGQAQSSQMTITESCQRIAKCRRCSDNVELLVSIAPNTSDNSGRGEE